jgi:hypothetical protein
MRGKYWTAGLLLGMALSAGYGQTGFTPAVYSSEGASYTQNFDGLPASGSFSLMGRGPLALSAAPINAAYLSGWQFLMSAGSGTNAGFATGTGTGTGNGMYSLGNSGSSDRALGSLSSSSGIYAFGLILTNQTGQLLNSFTISFTTEQWRKGGSTNKNTWTFHYKTGPISQLDEDSLLEESRLNFSSITTSASGSSLNGNLTDYQQVVSVTITGIPWRNGEQLLLRWDDADESGSDDIMAIDDFLFTASLNSSKPMVSNPAADSVTASTAMLSATIHDNDAATAILLQYDTIATLSTALTRQPAPDTINAGTGSTKTSLTLTGLLSGKAYYYRFIGTNTNGADTSSIQSFTTSVSLPTVTTTAPNAVGTQTAELGGTVGSEGGAPVTERGILWKSGGTPDLSDNRIRLGSGPGSFSNTLSGLPQGSNIYTRAYAINSGGIAFGNTEIFRTKNTILVLERTGTRTVNTTSVSFRLQVMTPVSGISAANFSVTSSSITGATISSVTGSGTLFTVTVTTGTGEGHLSIAFANDNGLSAPFTNIPYTATGFYEIDKTQPVIKQVSIPDKSWKIGDTIPLTISTGPDTALLILTNGTMGGITVTGFTRSNDSVYAAGGIVPENGKDIEASDSIPVFITVADPAGNSAVYQSPIRQPADRIDRTRPFISQLSYPPKGMYKSGDTLYFIARFSERIWVSGGTPYLTITIGTRSRMALYAGGSGTDSFVYRYIIQSGEKDSDGIKTATAISTGSALLYDASGNIALTGISNGLPSGTVLVDAILPAVTAVSTGSMNKYITTQELDLSISFSKKIWVRTGSALPLVQIVMGNKIRSAYYRQGSGSQTLVFQYTIQAGDRDTDGIKILSPFTDTDQSIRDSIGNPADTLLHNIAATTAIRINPPTALLTDLLLPADMIYAAGDSLLFTAIYSEPVFLSGSETLPYLNITIGKTLRRAYYFKGSGTSSLAFCYLVQAGEEDTDGISVSGSINTNNNTILDAKADPAPVGFIPVINKGKMRIDGIPPFVKTVELPPGKFYGTGDSLSFIFTFSKPVQVLQKDTVLLLLKIGSQQKKLTHRRNENRYQLFFTYRVQSGDLDKNGISIGSTLLATGIGIQDSIGNKASLGFSAGTVSGSKIDGVSPSFLSSTDTLLICGNSVSVSIAERLTISDDETGEYLYGEIEMGNKTSSISTKKFTAISTGKKIFFPGISYQPLATAIGTDTLTATISDGVNTIQKKIYIQITPLIRNNLISSIPVVCADKTAPPLQGSAPEGGNGKYLFYWETASSSDSTGFSKTAGNFEAIHYQPAALAATSWFRRIVQSGGCMDTSRNAKIIVLKNGLWLGMENSNWNDSGNWCGSLIPGAETDVYIFPATTYQPQINDTASCHQLILAENTALRINGILQLYGKLEAGASQLQAEKGTLVFSGKSLQQLTGKSFRQATIRNLLVNNQKGVLVTDPIAITGWLKLYTGKLYTNNQVWLKEEAVIGPSAAATGIEGKITATQLIKGGRRSFRLLAHPFSHTIGLSMIRDSVDITGAEGSNRGFTATQTNAASAFYFDYRRTNDSSGAESGWLPFSDTNGKEANAWNPVEGIRLLVRGKPGQGLDGTPAGDGKNGTYLPEAIRLAYSGEIRMGDREKILPATATESYHCIGNPYLASIDLSRINTTTGISRHYWLWNPWQGKQGGYTSYPFAVKNILPAFGSFIIRSDGGTAQQLLFTENGKSAEPVPDTVPAILTDEWYYVELRLETDSIFWDRILLVQMDSARWGIDRNDAVKQLNNDVNFYSLIQNGSKLSIDARPFNNESTMALGIESKQPQSFRIRVSAASLPASNTLMLHDRWLNRWMPLNRDSIYSFTVTNDTATQGNDRFEIRSPKKTTDSSNQETIRIRMSPVPVSNQLQISFVAEEKGNTSIRILSLAGKPLKAFSMGVLKEGQVSIPVGDLFRGIYLLELRCGNQIRSRKIIKE